MVKNTYTAKELDEFTSRLVQAMVEESEGDIKLEDAQWYAGWKVKVWAEGNYGAMYKIDYKNIARDFLTRLNSRCFHSKSYAVANRIRGYSYEPPASKEEWIEWLREVKEKQRKQTN